MSAINDHKEYATRDDISALSHQIDDLFTKLDNKIDALENKMNEKFIKVDERLNSIDVKIKELQFKVWTLWTPLTFIAGSVIMLLVGKFIP